ncbi:Piso0_000632 [Millerozyma farinosa CBS 7064]|uniref:Piso0_000632 protein n=1 Tax=Pichia sorbitophila (strain ATCC MYA-4447 / BCRC 22081 / CBS 7064 / NBRC 10061 / NRRL Y-12695) TaxID=559304 RepID=G8YPM3_PICSO|nr:Piso0_000632 [Millerozyma farinosa CBS 7064]
MMKSCKALLFLYVLFARVLCLPTYNITKGEEVSAKNAIPEKSEVEVREVRNFEEIAKKFKKVVESNKEVVFFLKDSQTFLARKNSSAENDMPQPIDDSNWKNGLSPSKLKELIQRKSRSEWVEFGYENIELQMYPGYIPVSACQSQELGQKGSVAFGYSYGEQLTNNPSIGISYEVGMLTLSLQLGVTLTSGVTVSGTTTCNINPGTIGQVFIKPFYVDSTPKGRRAVWSKRSQKFLVDKDFKRYDKMHTLTKDSDHEVFCVTSDIVDLYCEDNKIGYSDWSDPIYLGSNSTSPAVKNSLSYD